MRFDFKKTASDLFHKIEDKVAEIFGKEAELEAKRIEEKRKQFVEENRYNDNIVREVIPVLRSTHYSLDNANVNKQVAMQAISRLEEKLDNAERKRMETTALLTAALNSPLGNDYQVVYNSTTQEMMLFNLSYDYQNNNSRDASFRMPAVIAIDAQTNEPYAYATLTEMFATNPKYQAIKDKGEDYISNLSVISKSIVQCEGNGTYAENVISYVNARMNNVAQELQNELDITKQNANQSVIDKITPIIEHHSDCVAFNKETNQVFIRSDESEGHLLLNYSEDGLTSAFYKNNEGEVINVYDYRDLSNGFLKLDDKAYLNIIKGMAFTDLQAIDGNYIKSYTETELAHYKQSENIFIGDRYEAKSVGITEPSNPVFNYRNGYSAETEQHMTLLAQSYQKSVGEDINVTYNPFNNTINLAYNDKVVSLAFDEEGRRSDVFFHEKGKLIGENSIVVANNAVVNSAVLENKDFKHITNHLDFKRISITKGEAGKPIDKKTIELER